MAAFGTLVFYLQPPAGDRISLVPNSTEKSLDEMIPAGMGSWFYRAGTMALSAAVKCAVERHKVSRPEVLLPAYCCPSVVSAVIGAGARPVLADMQRDTLWVDLDDVERRICGSTVAIIAVSLFGVRQPLSSLLELTRASDALLIHDFAQGFPDFHTEARSEADLTVFSFGRGKQVSILGGGAVIGRQPAGANDSCWQSDAGRESPFSLAALILRASIYNVLRSPRFYYLVEKAEFLGLGETRYHALKRVTAMGSSARRLLSSNINASRTGPSSAQIGIRRIVEETGQALLTDLSHQQSNGQSQRLARYPLLAKNRDVREELVHLLRDRGIAASRMYRRALTGVTDIPAEVRDQGHFPIAEDLAGRLFSLPVHRDIDDDDLARIREVLSDPG